MTCEFVINGNRYTAKHEPLTGDGVIFDEAGEEIAGYWENEKSQYWQWETKQGFSGEQVKAGHDSLESFQQWLASKATCREILGE